MKILIPPKKKQPNLLSTLFEELLLEDSRIRTQEQVVSFSKLLIKQFGRLREDSKPTEKESLQLENLKNTLNTQWKDKRDLIAERKIDVCYAKITVLVLMTIIYASDTVSVFKTQKIIFVWYSSVIIMGILLSLVVLYTLLKLFRRIKAEKQSEKKLDPERQVVLEKMNDDYSEQLEKCMDFYSKEVMPLKEEARTLSNRVFILIIISVLIFLMNQWAVTFYGINEALKKFNNDSPFVVVVLSGAIIFTMLGVALVVGFLEFNEIEI
ncbi:hypothetical protein CRE_21591 [Caenorhabditis remanei]|uniref:Uncharacterized protein n=1 Tax=Caenorhabditis remanei TaxID=31234 RepID=E3NKG3_CAERE|nr:hypothetical protein CRE_21591 [Caenorhabditis remanei]